MKKCLFSFLCLIMTFSLFSNVKLEKIAIIDLEVIMETVFSGKSSAITQIKNEREKLQKTLNRIKENILKLEELKLKEKNDSRKIAYDKKIEGLKKQYSDYYKVKSYEIEKMKVNIQQPIYNEIRRVVKNIARTEGYTLVINKENTGIFYYNPDIDITEKVIGYFEENYGEDKE